MNQSDLRPEDLDLESLVADIKSVGDLPMYADAYAVKYDLVINISVLQIDSISNTISFTARAGSGYSNPTLDNNVDTGPDYPLDFEFSGVEMAANEAIKVTINLPPYPNGKIWYTDDIARVGLDDVSCAFTAGSANARQILTRTELGAADPDGNVRSASFLCRRKDNFTGLAPYNLRLKVKNTNNHVLDWKLDPKIKNNGTAGMRG